MCALNVCDMLGVASAVTFHLNPIGFSVFHVVHLGLIKSKIRVAVNALVRINFAVIHKAIPEGQARQLFICGYYFD